MLRRFAWFNICGSNTARIDDENNKITDSLEQCLSLEKGVKDFQSFLKKGKFQEEDETLQFLLKCRSILAEVARYSPNSRNQAFTNKLNADFGQLYDMAGGINFDQHQMEVLEDTFTTGTDQEKIDKIAEAEKWAMDVLQQIYQTFRRNALTVQN